jgi:hypothetical protein
VHTHYWPDVVARMTGTTDGIERTHDGIRVDRAIHPRGRQ